MQNISKRKNINIMMDLERKLVVAKNECKFRLSQSDLGIEGLGF